LSRRKNIRRYATGFPPALIIPGQALEPYGNDETVVFEEMFTFPAA
jgi:hypothetical protein